MRRNEIEMLATPYPGSAGPPPPDGLATALRVAVPEWKRLEAEILGDFTTTPPYGIAWWESHRKLGTSRRILISDYMLCAVRSTADNLIEAALHQAELLDSTEKDSDSIADAVSTASNGRATVRLPAPTCPMDDALRYLVRIHMVGALRALAGALDCMAASVIGVLAIPLSIHKASFRTLRDHLVHVGGTTTSSVLVQLQSDFAANLEAAVTNAGPPGWLDWAIAFRNMTVHRGRRLEIGQIVPRAPVIYGAGGLPVRRARRIHQLPLDPGRSDVEVLVDAPSRLLLAESAEQTIEGLMISVGRLVDSVGQLLRGAWIHRRHSPLLAEQPREQWREGRRCQLTEFSGYQPGAFPLNAGELVVHPETSFRLKSAALVDPHRGEWARFD